MSKGRPVRMDEILSFVEYINLRADECKMFKQDNPEANFAADDRLCIELQSLLKDYVEWEVNRNTNKQES